jgi:K+-sensing histidine kinase KdpD
MINVSREAEQRGADDGAVDELARERRYDAVALRIAERVRSSLNLHEVLQQTLNELGPATEVSRTIIQLAPNHSGVSLMFEWDRGDTRPLGLRPPTVIARRVFATGEPVIVDDVNDCADEDVAAYLRQVNSAAAISIPVVWGERVVAALGFHDDEPHQWRETALPLLQRLDTQIAAAIAQAEIFDQQQAALEQLRNLNRMREELIANVSHELRTPLAAIQGSAMTLNERDAQLSQEDRHALLETLQTQTERLSVLAEDILELARFRRGTQALRFGTTRFSDLVSRAGDGIMIPEGRNLNLVVDDDCDLRVDSTRLLQVMSNLIQNAVRHGSGDIFVRCRTEGSEAVIEVSDEGPGVPAEYRDEMFEPFSHRTDRSDSSGLGLSIARAIVEAHGGTLVYLPPLEGQRHQFVVTLPQRERPR